LRDHRAEKVSLTEDSVSSKTRLRLDLSPWISAIWSRMKSRMNKRRDSVQQREQVPGLSEHLLKDIGLSADAAQDEVHRSLMMWRFLERRTFEGPSRFDSI